MFDEIAEIGTLLHRLKAIDVRHRVFGSDSHQYRLGPILSERELRAFECRHGITLPEDYRCFLRLVGNGGAGPFYGMESLDSCWRDLSRPFPVEKAMRQRWEEEELSDEELDKLDEDPERDDFPGILQFCSQGCAIWSYLVVNGPTFGKVWSGREVFCPSDLSFSQWYRRWVERALRALENEKLVPRLRVGMSRAEVVATVGGEWKSRPAVGRPVWYLEARDIPVQLELDERDVVVKVKPWLFI